MYTIYIYLYVLRYFHTTKWVHYVHVYVHLKVKPVEPICASDLG